MPYGRTSALQMVKIPNPTKTFSHAGGAHELMLHCNRIPN